MGRLRTPSRVWVWAGLWGQMGTFKLQLPAGLSWWGLLPMQGAMAGGVPSELTLSPAWCWEGDFLLTWENMDVLVPIHVRRQVTCQLTEQLHLGLQLLLHLCSRKGSEQDLAEAESRGVMGLLGLPRAGVRPWLWEAAGAVVVQGCAALLGCPEPPLGMGFFVVLLMGMVLILGCSKHIG